MSQEQSQSHGTILKLEMVQFHHNIMLAMAKMTTSTTSLAKTFFHRGELVDGMATVHSRTLGSSAFEWESCGLNCLNRLPFGRPMLKQQVAIPRIGDNIANGTRSSGGKPCQNDGQRMTLTKIPIVIFSSMIYDIWIIETR